MKNKVVIVNPCEKHLNFVGEVCPMCLMDENNNLRQEVTYWIKKYDALLVELYKATGVIKSYGSDHKNESDRD